MLTPFNRTAGKNAKTMQDRVDLYLSKLTQQPGHDSHQIDNVSLTGGIQNCIEHGLGRAWMGYRVIFNDAGASIFNDATATQDPTKFLVLGCDIDCIASLEVF